MAAMARLPAVGEFHRAHSYCAYCPKLCRSACPVATVDGRETTTPWGKMSAVHHIDRGVLPLSAEHAEVFYACSGCMRCREHCDHRTPVMETLRGARHEALRAQVADEAAVALIDAFEDRVSAAGRAAATCFSEQERTRAASVAFVPGCTTPVVRTETATVGLRLCETVARCEVRCVVGECCGLPLLEAGDRDGFARYSRRFLGQLRNFEVAIFDDPGCLHALRVAAPAAGIEVDVTLRHLSEIAAERLATFARKPVSGPVRYHDACRLGRGLGIYEPPRIVLERILGRPPDELPVERAMAMCVGGGGLLPKTRPAIADAITDEVAAEHRRVGDGLLLSACPTTVSRLVRRGIRAQTWSEFVCDALDTVDSA